MKDVTLNSRKTLRARGVAAYYGIGVATVWRWAKEGKLPKGTRLSPRVTVWRIEDLERLLDQATDVKDILAIETELNRVQGDVDSMEARIKALKGRVDYAVLDLHLSQKPPAKILGPLGYLLKGLFWTVEKLFVIRE